MIPGRTALLHVVVAAAFTVSVTNNLEGQERPAKRVADIVGVAMAEYDKGVDANGRLISQLEYEEAVSFLGTARESARRLSGTGADSARTALDSISAIGRASAAAPGAPRRRSSW